MLFFLRPFPNHASSYWLLFQSVSFISVGDNLSAQDVPLVSLFDDSGSFVNTGFTLDNSTGFDLSRTLGCLGFLS